MKLCDYYGNPWIGMFAISSDKLTLVPLDMMDKTVEIIRKNLSSEVVKTTIGDSNLIGIYAVMNSNGIILPNIATENEIATMKRLGLNVYVSSDKYNANGNNICANDRGGIINEHVSKEEKKKIEETLGIELVQRKIANYTTVGSSCIANNNGFLLHYSANENDVDELRNIFKVNGMRGTVNTGTGFVSLGIIANNRGYVAGEKTTAFESGRVEEALGFIK